MIYITGDIHGTIDLEKLKGSNFKEKEKMTKDDYLIIVGDFGAVWSGEFKDRKLLDWYEEQNYTTLFIDGNHENFDLLNKYDEREWNGGKIHEIRPTVYHLMRGEVFIIEEKTFFIMGGANSIDKLRRIPGVSWWAQEIPNEAEMNLGIENLNKVNNKVDFMLTHSAPLSFVEDRLRLITDDDRDKNFLMYLESLLHKVEFKDWYFGHYHQERDEGKLHLLYDRIIRIN